MTQDEAIALFRTAVVALSGLADERVVLGYSPQVPRLAVGHVYIVPTADARVGFPRQATSSVVNQSRRATVTVDAVGTDACAALRQAVALLWSDASAVRTLTAAGVATQGIGDVIDTSVPMATAYEPRCTVDVDLGYVFAVAATAGPPATQINLSTTAEGALDVGPVVAEIPVP